ncbi:MAG: hypothetical protein ABIV47_14940 [Roseiflexaceae bacterium]
MAKRRLTIFAAAALFVGVILGLVLIASRPPLPTPLALTTSTPPISKDTGIPIHRIAWNGGSWYMQGINVPWYNWGCDFGCNLKNDKTGGVSTNIPILSAGFAQVKDAGMHVVRWWVFPGDPAQITRDASGVPIEIDPAVYADFDAALQLAEQYDIYYNFVLFSAPTHIPKAWQTDPLQRAKLVDALSPLFAHYANNPRIISWEPYNEPENDIWKWRIAQQPVVDTGTAIAQSVHANAPGTYVTIGHFKAEGMKMWLDAGLDYYSPHWYDYMSSGDNCIICHDYSYYAAWGIDKPIVIGEYYTATSETPLYSSIYRNNYWYAKNYAGAWSWSLFPGQSSDGMVTDFTAAKAFAAQHSDFGPISLSIATPSPTATE